MAEKVTIKFRSNGHATVLRSQTRSVLCDECNGTGDRLPHAVLGHADGPCLVCHGRREIDFP